MCFLNGSDIDLAADQTRITNADDATLAAAYAVQEEVPSTEVPSQRKSTHRGLTRTWVTSLGKLYLSALPGGEAGSLAGWELGQIGYQCTKAPWDQGEAETGDREGEGSQGDPGRDEPARPNMSHPTTATIGTTV